jgi:signal transduction histidine kinase
MQAEPTAASRMPGAAAPAGWVELTPEVARHAGAAPSGRRLLVGLVAAAVLVVLAVVAVGVVVARQLAENEAVHDAARSAELLGDVIVEPALSDALLAGDPAAVAALDELVASRVIGDAVVRVKIWNADGTILYSDEPRLIGERFGLDGEELEVLEEGGVEAEVSDLGAPENRFERGQGALLEAYHGVTVPGGETLLFEAYFRYDQVSVRTGELWTAFSLLSAGSVLALLVLLLPLVRRLVRFVQDARRHREAALQQALDASSAERRRIAARLHDGAIQDLTASSLALAAGASAARRAGDTALAEEFTGAAGTLRASVSGLRSLLVDMYPPGLSAAGIRTALDDLATAVGGRGVPVMVVETPHRELGADEARLVFRVVRECLANVVRHAHATSATVTVRAGDDGAGAGGGGAGRGGGAGTGGGGGTGAGGRSVVVEISDDGRGFDPARLGRPEAGHVGVPLVVDAVATAGASLAVLTAPGSGTRWRLTLPVEAGVRTTPRRPAAPAPASASASTDGRMP